MIPTISTGMFPTVTGSAPAFRKCPGILALLLGAGHVSEGEGMNMRILALALRALVACSGQPPTLTPNLAPIMAQGTTVGYTNPCNSAAGPIFHSGPGAAYGDHPRFAALN
jgi:hypothetical protein